MGARKVNPEARGARKRRKEARILPADKATSRKWKSGRGSSGLRELLFNAFHTDRRVRWATEVKINQIVIKMDGDCVSSSCFIRLIKFRPPTQFHFKFLTGDSFSTTHYTQLSALRLHMDFLPLIKTMERGYFSRVSFYYS